MEPDVIVGGFMSDWTLTVTVTSSLLLGSPSLIEKCSTRGVVTGASLTS